MALAILTFGIAFAAFCVWLTVRIVNRRERWAKWALAAAVGLPALYILSFGPACWITGQTNHAARYVSPTYKPICLLLSHIPQRITQAVRWYAAVLAPDGWSLSIHDDADDWRWEFSPPFNGYLNSVIE
jgi:hypothetical protein